jgi:hypothetical protein
MSDNNGWPGKPGIREKLEYALAMHFSNNRMPHMSGDPRNRLSSLQRRNMEDAVTSILEVIGPVLTPAEVDARVKEEAARLIKQTADVLSNPSAKDSLNYVAAAIRALKGEGND